jgi:hypothetical protein
MNVWVAVVLFAVASGCSRNTSAVNSPPPSDVNNLTPSPSAPAEAASPAPAPSNANDVSPSPTPPGQTPSPPPLDVNDISFLWPVPQTKADVDALISLNDEAADGKIFPDELFGKLIDEAKTVSVGNTRISFPNEADFRKPITWKVAGIRVNPSALGTHPLALIQGGIIPSIRLIVQPVTVNGDKFKIHDFTAHVVFLQTLPHPDKSKPFQPDNDAFAALVKDLREIKAFLEQAGVTTANQELNIHPGFRFTDKANEVPGFTDKIRAMLKKNLSSKRLGVISFMGIPGQFEPWIFFKVTVENGNLTREPVSGHFVLSDPNQKQPMSQMLSNLSGNLKVEPSPVPDASALKQGIGVGTALLFNPDVASHLDDDLFPTATNEARGLKLRHVADFIANPSLRNTGNTDCVSCHTETTRRNTIAGLTAPEGIAFKQPSGISKVAASVLPKDKWNVRDFGWGFNFFVDKGFKPTVTQRAANEAAQSADLMNKGPLEPPVPQPVALANDPTQSSGPQ